MKAVVARATNSAGKRSSPLMRCGKWEVRGGRPSTQSWLIKTADIILNMMVYILSHYTNN
jgi:hypothetical protein